ncbi:MAG: hypothetical protein PF542_01115 [Nanoarchaeota archaeon]|nr:hypothetical protein [Nanoarchaeota archaeon]
MLGQDYSANNSSQDYQVDLQSYFGNETNNEYVVKNPGKAQVDKMFKEMLDSQKYTQEPLFRRTSAS